MSKTSESQKRANRRYYELHREKLIEKAKEISKKRYVPVEKKNKSTKKSKTESRMDFINEIIPMIKERIDLSTDEEIRLPSFEDKGWTYYNFRKFVFKSQNEDLIEILVCRVKEHVSESAWFYYKPYDAKKSFPRSIEVEDFCITDYKTFKK